MRKMGKYAVTKKDCVDLRAVGRTSFVALAISLRSRCEAIRTMQSSYLLDKSTDFKWCISLARQNG